MKIDFSAIPVARAALAALLAGPLAGALCHAAESSWKPSDTVEIVVSQGPGGTTDLMARLMQRILRDQGLIEAPVNVINRPGGGGAIGLNYLAKRPADGHTLSIANTTLLSTHIAGRSPLTYTHFTPIATLAQEHVAFAAHPTSPLNSGKDLLDRMKQDPTSISIAIGAAVGNQNHIAVALVAKAIGADPRKLKTVIFKSGGETMTQILGGHVDLGMTSAGQFVKHVEAGKVRLLAVAAPQRLEGQLASVPTWREQGVDSVAGLWFTVIAPAGTPAEAVRYWERAVAAIVKDEEWRQFVNNRQMLTIHRDSAGATAFLKDEYDRLKGILAELGLVK
jgi:putative tricarboxylic transport membrane protein